jgi:hypothetical protein
VVINPPLLVRGAAWRKKCRGKKRVARMLNEINSNAIPAIVIIYASRMFLIYYGFPLSRE